MTRAARSIAFGLFVFTCFLFDAAVGLGVLAAYWVQQ